MLISKAIQEYCSFGPKETGFFVQTDQYGYWNIIVEFESPLN